MYDQFSEDYDRFVNWPGRLAAEMPFLETQLRRLTPGEGGRLRVLDAACGTGMHTIALAQLDRETAGADLSAAMIQQARRNAQTAGVSVRFDAVGFGRLAETFGVQAFDAVLCLGNSLPHALTHEDLAAALRDFAACLRPGGLLLVQNRNFDAVLASGERWMEPQAHRDDEVERIFLRFYDFEPAGVIAFNVITLRRAGDGPWTQRVMTTRLRPLIESELLAALGRAGVPCSETYGNLAGAAFDPAASPNLVTVSFKPEGA